MRTAGFVTIAVVVGLSGPAFAQTGSGQQSAANPPVGQATTNPSSDNPRGWMASGFIGTNFGSGRSTSVNLTAIEDLNTNNSTSVNFGGQVGYLARGVIGAEFLADFSPGFGIFDNALFQQSPDVNSYMFNLIAAAPFGQVQSVDPYVSGGIGAVTLHSDIFTLDPTRTPNINAIATESVSGSRFGWNLGGGIMAWSEKNWGFRGDVRYYKTTSGNNDVLDLNDIGDGTVFTRLALSGISFWKVNAGVAFRW
jgi:hypothetical protein